MMDTEHFLNKMIIHGILVMLLGLVAGFGLTFSILGQVSLSPIPFVIDYQMPSNTAAWARMHVGNLLNGIMLVAFASILPRFSLGRTAAKRIAYGFIFVAWSNAAFYVFGAFAPNRGLALSETPAGPANWASFIAYIPAVIAAVLLIVILIYLVMQRPGSKA